MGWLVLDDHPEAEQHEGFVVGLVQSESGWLFREIHSGEEPPSGSEIKHIQVACDCGWRSRRLLAPLGTKWVPCYVHLPSESDEDEASLIWRLEHRDRLTDGRSLFSLARTLSAVPS